MVVPFQMNWAGGAVRFLLISTQEGRRADRAGERFAQHMAQPRRSGPHDQPEGRRGRFRLGRLAQQEQRVAGIAGAMMQPARRRQVEAGGVAARLQKHGGKTVERAPPARRSTARRQACPPARPAGGRDRCRKGNGCPADRDSQLRGSSRPCRSRGRARLFFRASRRTSASTKAAAAPASRVRRMDLGEPGARQAAAQRCVETSGSGDEKISRSARPPMPDAPDRRPRGALVETLGEAAFDLRDLMAQGRQWSPAPRQTRP